MDLKSIVKGAGIAAAAGLVLHLSSVNPADSLERRVQNNVGFLSQANSAPENLSSMFYRAQADESLREEFVKKVKESLQLPDYITDIRYIPVNEPNQEGLPQQMSVDAVLKIESDPSSQFGIKIKPSNSIVNIYSLAFNGRKTITYGDFLSLLTEHEFHHANQFSISSPLAKDAYDSKGNFLPELFKILNELESYKAELTKSVAVSPNGLILNNPNLSREYILNQIVDSRMNFERLSEFEGINLRFTSIDKIRSRYDLPHYRFLNGPGLVLPR